MNRWFTLVSGVCLSLFALVSTAADLQLTVEFVEGKPVLRAVLDAPATEDGKPFRIPVRVYDLTDDKKVWDNFMPIPVAEAAPHRTEWPIPRTDNPKHQYRVEVDLRGEYGIHMTEQFWFGSSTANMYAYSLRLTGVYPTRRVALRIGLVGFPDADNAEAPISWQLRDSDDNALVSRTEKVTLTPAGGWHSFDVTPDVAASVGPYRLEYELELEAQGLFASAAIPFGFANARVPVTSMESDMPVWFPSEAGVPREGFSSSYYSPELDTPYAGKYPVMVYDEAVTHESARSMRIDYEDGREARVFSTISLPGRPTSVRVWVKGNNTNHTLYAYQIDHVNNTLAGWGRNPFVTREAVCRLDFEGWREFVIPALGDGLAVPSRNGSTEAIDGPPSILALVVDAGRLGNDQVAEPRSIWIDDITVDTQAQTDERLDLELRLSDPHGRLQADTVLHATVGNGAGSDLTKALLTLTARDADGQTVHTMRQEIAIANGRTAMFAFPLAELAAKKPKGPVLLQVTAFDPTIPGLRTSQSRVLKLPMEGGLFIDFEEPVDYSGFVPFKSGVVSAGHIVERGEGGGHALAITVGPKIVDEEASKDRNYVPPANSVLLHPSLPGTVATVSLQVRGGAQPVELQPMLLDSGSTGVSARQYNVFWVEPILVDWQGWREVTIQAPPIPVDSGSRDRYYLFEPCYPLNLAFEATLVGEQTAGMPTAEIRIDSIRVSTHLPEAEQLQAEIVWPTELRLHAPGSALRVAVRNYAATDATRSVTVRLQSLQGPVVHDETMPIAVAAGALERPTLIPSLTPGLYKLTVTGLLAEPMEAYITVLDATAYFGDDPLATARDLVALRRSLGQMEEKVYLDFDNTEPVPQLFHFTFFEQVSKQVGADGAYTLMPVFGFSADWAGPEAQESIANGTYYRTFPNLLQVPVRAEDWSQFIRECLREYHAQYDTWIFWENPDLADAPQSIPPARYRPMLAAVYKWVKRYDPDATVVAGGFNYDRVLSYLEQIEEPHTLPFDEIAVQMNLAELSPEQAEMEGFLDELSALLHLRETGRAIRTAELDWGIGEYVSPMQQAAYHIRAGLILDSRGARPHTYTMINTGNAFTGYGVFYRDDFGNSEVVQTFKDWHIPKPSYFALIHLRRFLADWTFATRVELPDRQLTDNRAFVYTNTAGRMALVLWRVADDQRRYRWPQGWEKLAAEDMFGFPLLDREALLCNALPSVYYLPEGMTMPTLLTTLRHLETTDGTWPVILDLHLAEATSRDAAGYTATGTITDETRGGVIPGGRALRETFRAGTESETFTFQATSAGDVLLRRRWYFDGTGQTLTVRVNDGAPLTWTLTEPQDKAPGIRESTVVLRGCVAGANSVAITADRPAAVSGYRLEPLADASVDLARWGMLAARQSNGVVATYQNAVGTTLRIGETRYEQGVGAHAVGYIEYPLAGQFERFEVTVGIDGITEGRGSVVFRIYADGKEVATSGPLNGFSKPKTLTVDELTGVQRLILSVTDSDDGSKNDLANWVDGHLILPTK